MFWYAIQRSQWKILFFCEYSHPSVQRYIGKNALLIREAKTQNYKQATGRAIHTAHGTKPRTMTFARFADLERCP